jgi:hypothetical protein
MAILPEIVRRYTLLALSVTGVAIAQVGAVSVTPNAGSGASQTFQATYSDALGTADLKTAWLWITPAFGGSGANTCMLYLDRVANTLNLLNDAGNTWMAAPVSVSGTLQNNQCYVNVGAATVALAQNNLTLTVPLTFKSGFAGAKEVWLYGAGGTANSGWQKLGAWTILGGTTVSAVSVTPSAGSGSTQAFQLVYSDSLGTTDLKTGWVWFTPSFAGAGNTCMLYYDRAANSLNLLNDAGTTWTAAVVGVPGTLQNSQCAVDAGSTTAVPSSTNLIVTVPMTFKTGFAGAKEIWLFGAATTATSGWQKLGTWTVPSLAVTVSAVSVTPNAGSGSVQSFQLLYSDTLGASDLKTTWVWFTPSFGAGANTCMLYYDRVANSLNLLNDAGGAWMAAAVGAPGTLQNSQCAVDVGATMAIPAGSSLALTLPISFKAGYAGAKEVWLYGAGSAVNSGWQKLGSWTVPIPLAVSAVSVTPNAGSGSVQSFQFLYSDTLGASDLKTTWVWFTPSFGAGANTCMLYYDRAANSLNLLNDAGTTWTSAVVGVSGTLQNSQCGVDVGASTAIPAGTNLILTLPLSFNAAFAGAKEVWLYGAGNTLNSGWQKLGAWTATGGGLLVTSTAVGQNLEASVTITGTTPAPVGGLSITLTSSDPSKLVIGSQLNPGTSPVTLSIPEGPISFSVYVQALASSGTVTLTAHSPGYTDGTATITLTPSAFVLAGPSGIGVPSFPTNVNLTTVINVFAARLDSSNNYVETQRIRGGLNNVAVSLSSSQTTVGTLSPPAVSFSAGDSSWSTMFSAVGTGSTIIGATEPAGFSVPASGLNTLTANVGGASMTAPNITVGKGLQVPAQVTLTGVPSADQTLTLTSNDSARLRFGAAPTDTGSGTISILIKAGHNASPIFYVQGFDNIGTATYSATMPGFGTTAGTVTFGASGIVIAGPSGFGFDFTTTRNAPPTTLTLSAALLNSSGNYVESEAIAGGAPVTFNVSSSNMSVGTIITSPVTIAGGSVTVTTDFSPSGVGTTVLSAVQPSGFTTPNQYRTVTATVSTASIAIADGVSIGKNLQIQAILTLGEVAPTGGLSVTLTSNNPNLLLSATQNGVGSLSIVVPVAAGAFSGTYYLQAFGSSGTVTYQANAPGYVGRTASVTLTPSGVVLGDTLGNIGTTAFGSSPVSFGVYMAQLDALGSFQQIQQLAAGASSVSVSLSTNAGTVGTPVTIAPGSQSNTSQLTASSGNVTVTATTPPGYTPSDALALHVFVF